MRTALVSAVAMLFACSATASPRSSVSGAAQLDPAGALAPCSADVRAKLVDPHAPIAVLVHGCNASEGRFRSLAEVFALHGQETLCFRYDDRRRIHEVGAELARDLSTLSARLPNAELTVLGHSQGGLVARAAAARITSLHDVQGRPTQLRLVTVSSPFNGIRAATHCGAAWLHVLSLGITLGVCRAIAGATWRDIHPGAASVRFPAPLAGGVASHLEIRTDERGSCRQYANDGRCFRSDFVFSLDEQTNPRLQGDRRVRTHVVRAGHVEIVGSEHVPPHKLLFTLQQQHVLRTTPTDKRAALHALLQRLF